MWRVLPQQGSTLPGQREQTETIHLYRVRAQRVPPQRLRAP